MKPHIICPHCQKRLNASPSGWGQHAFDVHKIKGEKMPPITTGKRCDFDGCDSINASRKDIKTNWFRGDDIVLNLCAYHKKNTDSELLATMKARIKLLDIKDSA